MSERNYYGYVVGVPREGVTVPVVVRDIEYFDFIKSNQGAEKLLEDRVLVLNALGAGE